MNVNSDIIINIDITPEELETIIRNLKHKAINIKPGEDRTATILNANNITIYFNIPGDYNKGSYKKK